MTHLIQLTTLDSITSFAKRKFQLDHFPKDTQIQSDRAVTWAKKFTDKAWQIHSIQSKAMEIINVNEWNQDDYIDKLASILIVMHIAGVKDHMRAREVGVGRAHRQYMYLIQLGLERGLTNIEWLLAILYYDKYYDERRNAFKEHTRNQQDEKAKKREIASLETKLANKLERIKKLEAYIEEQKKYLANWQDDLEDLKDRIVELRSEVSSE